MHIESVLVSDITQDVKDLLYNHLYKPWGVELETDWLCADDGGEFLVARDEDGAVLGTVRIMPADGGTPGHPTPVGCEGERRLRQVIVDPTARGRGIGSKLMQMAEAHVLGLGIDRVGVAARSRAYNFYLNNGYIFQGEEYISPLTHMAHRHMSKAIQP